jgi:hypothetical protein
LATNDTTPHVYGKAMLVVAFDSSMWIITISEIRVICIVDSITGKMGLVGEQNITNRMGVRINTTAQFQLVTHVLRFKMLNALDAVRVAHKVNTRQLRRGILSTASSINEIWL